MEYTQLIIKGKSYKVKIDRKNVKNINFRLGKENIIKISIPHKLKISILKQILTKNIGRLDRLIARNSEKMNLENSIKSESQFLYLGNKYALNFSDSHSKLELHIDEYCLNIPQQLSSKNNLIDYLDLYYKFQAERLLPEYYKNCYESLKSKPKKMPLLKIRKMRRNWGTCYPNRPQINLNYRLVMLPELCINLIIYHEFTHLFHPHHGKEFYNHLQTEYYNWKNAYKLLKNYSPNY